MVRALLLALVLLLAGCYRYVPARSGAVPPGAEVRLHLSDEGAQRLQGFTGSEPGEVTGEVLEWAEQVVVSVRIPAAEGMTDRDLRSRVVVALGDVAGVDVRERDRTRTALLVGGLTAVVTTALVAAVSGVFGGGSRVEQPGEEEGAVIPAWLGVFR